MHLKHGYCMLIHFIHGYYCIYCPWQPLTYLYFPYCISLIYFSFTKIRMFLYAQIYWLAEFGDVSCLQLTIWEWRLSLRPGRILSDNFKSEVRQNSVSDLRVWSLIHLEGSVLAIKLPLISYKDQTTTNNKKTRYDYNLTIMKSPKPATDNPFKK